ncbi:hypothetical protein F4604DRAFT_1923512 [Suillus subluteus]|nr:hypothetical protein F4604DRAFT_1923512 [Suillus subluteus]
MTQAISCYIAANTNLSEHTMHPMDWQVLQDFEVILEAPHACQQLMSSESTPMLSGAVSALEHLIEQWEKTAWIATHCAPMIEIGLTWAEKYSHRMSKTNTYGVAMFIDPTLRLLWIDGHWGEEKACAARDFIMKLLQEKRAGSIQDPLAESPAQQSHTNTTLGAQLYGIPDIDLLLCHLQGVQTVEEEFNAYSMSHLSPNGTDVLAFWKAKLEIPLSYHLQACNGLPSDPGLCMKKRNYLSPALMEILQMLKFLLKKERLNFTKGWSASEQEMEYYTQLEYSEAQPLNQDLEVLAKNQGTLSLTSNLKTHSIKWLLEISTDPEVFIAATCFILQVEGPLDLAYPGHSNFFGWETQDDDVLSGTLDSGIANHMVVATTPKFCSPEGVSFLIPDTDSIPALGQLLHVLPYHFVTEQVEESVRKFAIAVISKLLSSPSLPSNQIIANCTFLACVMVGVQFDKKDIIQINKRYFVDLGDHMEVANSHTVFDKFEVKLAQAMMSIPATKAFEVGSGFRGTEVPGSKHNDAFILKDGKLEEVLKSNEHITIITEFHSDEICLGVH